MEALDTISEIKILPEVRLVGRKDLFMHESYQNLHVQFSVSGDMKGMITCYLCLDDHDLNQTEKNYIFPLFVEAMNILIGKQISLDKQLAPLKVLISPPKLSMISQVISTSLISKFQKYELELNSHTFSILTEYNIEALS